MLHSIAARRVLDSLAQAEVAAGAGATTEAVVWTAIVGCAVDAPNTLRKTAATGWGTGGAVSTRAIRSGDGYVEITVSEINTRRMVGLGVGNASASYTDIDFALYLDNGTLSVYENGASRGGFGAISNGMVLRVAVEGGIVVYRKAGLVVYTSLVAPTYPLNCDAAGNTIGSTIAGATISGLLGASGY